MCLTDHGSLRSFERNQLDFFKKNKKSSCVVFSRLFILATKSLIPIYHIHVVVQLCLVLILCFFVVLVSICSSLHCLICCLFGRFNIFNGKVFWSELTIPCTTRKTKSYHAYSWATFLNTIIWFLFDMMVKYFLQCVISIFLKHLPWRRQ